MFLFFSFSRPILWKMWIGNWNQNRVLRFIDFSKKNARVRYHTESWGETRKKKKKSIKDLRFDYDTQWVECIRFSVWLCWASGGHQRAYGGNKLVLGVHASRETEFIAVIDKSKRKHTELTRETIFQFLACLWTSSVNVFSLVLFSIWRRVENEALENFKKWEGKSNGNLRTSGFYLVRSYSGKSYKCQFQICPWLPNC